MNRTTLQIAFTGLFVAGVFALDASAQDKAANETGTIITAQVVTAPVTQPAAPAVTPPVNRSTSIDDLLKSSIVEDRKAGYARICELADAQNKSLLAGLPRWLPRMLADMQFDDVEKVCSFAVRFRPQETATVSLFQRARVRALIGKGDFTAATLQAKSYYNMAQLNETQWAMQLLATAIEAGGKGDKSLANEVRELEFGDHGISSIKSLSSIKINAGDYDAALQGKSKNLANYDDRIACGNLLLLMDRPDDAFEAFRSILSLNDLDKSKCAGALDGLMRAVRTRDGMNKAKKLLSRVKGHDPETMANLSDSPGFSKFADTGAGKVKTTPLADPDPLLAP